MVKNSTACNSNQRWNNETCQCECKNYQTYKEDSQLANICPQDVQRPPLATFPESPLKSLLDHHGDVPIWRPDLMLWWCPEMTSRECTNLTSKGPPCDADSGRPQDVLRTSPRGPSKHILETIVGSSFGLP